ISFTTLSNQTVGAAPITLDATASSGLAVTFTVISGPATVSGNLLTITGPGAVVVQASQAGDGTFAPASPGDEAVTGRHAHGARRRSASVPSPTRPMVSLPSRSTPAHPRDCR